MRYYVDEDWSKKFCYCDETTFVFNPNFIEVYSSYTCTLKVSVSVKQRKNGATSDTFTRTKDIYAVIPGAKPTKVYISRVVELLFEEPEAVRVLEVQVDISEENGTKYDALHSFSFNAIWGSVAPGERFNALGAYAVEGDKLAFHRDVVFFKNFPFNLSIYQFSPSVVPSVRFDNTSTVSYNWPTRMKLSRIERYETVSVSSITTDRVDELVYFERTNIILAYNRSNSTWHNKWAEAGGFPAYTEYALGNSNYPNALHEYIIEEGGIEFVYKYIGHSLQKVNVQGNVGFRHIDLQKNFSYAQKCLEVKYKVSEKDSTWSVFDKTFDFTFKNSGEATAIINMIFDYRKAGYYLRWIDNQGNLQYFLFTKGKTSEKTTVDKTGREDIREIGGMFFNDIVRKNTTEIAKTCKAGATGLSDSIYSYVKTIASAFYVDMFLGYDSKKNELWVPVTIEAATFDYEERDVLHNIELKISVPTYTPQTL